MRLAVEGEAGAAGTMSGATAPMEARHEELSVSPEGGPQETVRAALTVVAPAPAPASRSRGAMPIPPTPRGALRAPRPERGASPFWNAALAASRLLTATEEKALARRVQAGLLRAPPGGWKRPDGSVDHEPRIGTKDAQRAFDALVLGNVRFAYGYATKQARVYRMNKDDLIQQANEGLMAAAKRFNPSRDLRFLSYAVWWIRAYVGRWVMGDFSLVRIGTTDWQRRGFARALACAAGDAEKLDNSTISGGRGEMRPLRRDSSLSAPVNVMRTDGGDGSYTVGDAAGTRDDMIFDALPALEDADLVNRTRAAVARALNALPPREREIIRARFLTEEKAPAPRGPNGVGATGIGYARGLNGEARDRRNTTLQELGTKYNVSRERIRQIERVALQKLRAELRRDPTMRAILREQKRTLPEGSADAAEGD